MHWSLSDESSFSNHPYYDAPTQRHPHSDERLRHVVFLDGRLIDSWTEPVEGTAYRAWAREFDLSVQPRIYDRVDPPPHEAVLAWLDAVAGGRAALLALDATPLERPELPGVGEGLTHVVALLERVSVNLFDPEFLAAACAVVTTLRRTDPEVLKGMPAEVAGGICWVVGRANGSVGAGTAVTQKVLTSELGVKAALTPRATRIKTSLRGLLPSPGRRPDLCPDLLELGLPACLTSTTRTQLLHLRDRALAAAERAKRDEEARASLLPRKVET